MHRNRSLGEFIDQLPLISTHEHHREDDFQRGLDLFGLFTNSYVGWGPWPKGETVAEREAWLSLVRYKAYFVWLEKAIAELYGVERVTGENWEELSAKIRAAQQEPGYHVRVLKERARYRRFLQDAYWNPGSDAGHPEIATPVYRIDMWLAGFHPQSQDHDAMSVHGVVGREMRTLTEYEEALREQIRRRRSGIAALKCAVAYERPIGFGPADREAAVAVFGKDPRDVSAEQKRAFGDYVFDVAMKMAAELDLPVQVHAGLGQLAGSNPLLLEPAIARHPKVRFVLFHGGYPWTHHVAALAHNHGNVLIDLCWLPLISTSAAEAALSEYIEVSPDITRIAWGGDCWTSEECVGAAMAFKHVLKRVLARKIQERYLTAAGAEALAESLCWRNAAGIYHIE